ncbi:O-methyltransferase [Thermophagus xiamenensis]|uniref:Predicted O-methyltransferase YrrM n=1 Tax=Thermophagus xiamenensis TaxID=385682 RepID=A0A1I2FBC4_9BACT|nr:O-methyltransferase [Thermophagus xiamenensis]SFF02323.1 Predicted O-methyltransferase YrrM [Thermophagus xiamenensis]
MSSHTHITGNPNKDLELYIETHTSPEDELLYELRRQTHLKVLRPRMVSGQVQGQLLTMLCRMIQPKTVLEIGTFTGYSAICMARGMGSAAHLHTIERDDELETFIRQYICKAGLQNRIHLHIGDALNIIKTLNASFDLVFIDGDKREYPEYYKMVIEKMNPGGYILADNILWNGKVIDPEAQNDSYTKGILAFNKMVKEDPRVEQVILPMRDGLMMIRVKD